MQSIIAGIVLYNPEILRLKENIDSIINQVKEVILIDNSSVNIEEVLKEFGSSNKIHIIKNNINMGIAAALNQIAKYCEEKKYDWVITLDQDTVCSDNLISQFEKYINCPNVGIITPRIIDRNFLLENNIQNRQEYDYVDLCITSAALTNVKICAEVGYWDESMFIDMVDFDYCIRLRKKGYKILRVNNISVKHELGNSNVVNIFGKKIIVYNHSAVRKYYYTRNSIYLIKKHHGFIESKSAYLNLLKRTLVTVTFEKNKLSKIKEILRGIRDSNKINTH